MNSGVVFNRNVGQIDVAVACRESVSTQAVRRDDEFLHDLPCVSCPLGFNSKILQGGIGGDDLEEDQAVALDTEALLDRDTVHRLGVLQSDEFTIANPDVGP